MEIPTLVLVSSDDTNGSSPTPQDSVSEDVATDVGDVGYEVEIAFDESELPLETLIDFGSSNEKTQFEVQSGHSKDEVFHGDLESGRKRKKRANRKEWQYAQNKIKRMKGQAYIGEKKRKDEEKKTQTRPPRVIGLTCTSRKCMRSKTLLCNEVCDVARETIFKTFWDVMDWGQKKVYVCSLIKKIEPQQRKATGSRRRSATYVYNLNIGDKNVKVCKQMFLRTLGLGEKQVRGWIECSNVGIPLSSPTVKTNKDSSEKNDFLMKFFQALPKMPSHYCRQKTSKLYLEPIFNSKSQLMRVYKEKCAEEGLSPASRFKFDQVFEELNLSLFQPKKDQCDLCCSHKVGNTTEAEWQAHILKKDRARAEKTKDKEAAADNQCYVLTMDLESVKVCPMLKASALYYKTKLCVHNFTVYDIVSHHSTCYWWHEGEGDLQASTYASCLIDFLVEHCVKDLLIIIYSDGCTSQNRNHAMSNALLHFAINTKKIIIQKYLEKGHTQMECDSVHSAIETKLKNREVHLPSEYTRICREARINPAPYNSKDITHEFFRDYAEKTLVRYDSIRPGQKTGDNVVTDIRALKYNPDGLIFYQLDFDEEWQALPRRPKQVNTVAFPPLYSSKLKITGRKWKDLQELKNVLPSDCHSFYDELPHQTSV